MNKSKETAIKEVLEMYAQMNYNLADKIVEYYIEQCRIKNWNIERKKLFNFSKWLDEVNINSVFDEISPSPSPSPSP